MPSDSELKEKYSELLSKLNDLEDRIIGNEELIRQTLMAFKVLEHIFENSLEDNKLLEKLKIDDEDIEKVIKKNERVLSSFLSLDKEKSDYIGENHAFASTTGEKRMMIFKRSFLHRFIRLKKEGEDVLKLNDIVIKKDKDFSQKFDNEKGKEYIKENIGFLKEFTEIIESQISFLSKNKSKIIQDKRYAFSVFNVILHELVHELEEFKEKSYKGKYARAYNELFAHSIQAMNNLYSEKEINFHVCEKYLNTLKELINSKKNHNEYAPIFETMDAFYGYLGSIIVCDAILRKKGNDFGKKILKECMKKRYFSLLKEGSHTLIEMIRDKEISFLLKENLNESDRKISALKRKDISLSLIISISV
jgi:hypothetical protein